MSTNKRQSRLVLIVPSNNESLAEAQQVLPQSPTKGLSNSSIADVTDQDLSMPDASLSATPLRGPMRFIPVLGDVQDVFKVPYPKGNSFSLNHSQASAKSVAHNVENGNGNKTGNNSSSSRNLPPNTRVLLNWVPRLQGKELTVEGNILQSGRPSELRWMTSKIVRADGDLVFTSKTPYLLQGAMSIDNIDPSVPKHIQHGFKHGFPDCWEDYRDSWKLIVKSQGLSTATSLCSMPVQRTLYSMPGQKSFNINEIVDGKNNVNLLQHAVSRLQPDSQQGSLNHRSRQEEEEVLQDHRLPHPHPGQPVGEPSSPRPSRSQTRSFVSRSSGSTKRQSVVSGIIASPKESSSQLMDHPSGESTTRSSSRKPASEKKPSVVKEQTTAVTKHSPLKSKNPKTKDPTSNRQQKAPVTSTAKGPLPKQLKRDSKPKPASSPVKRAVGKPKAKEENKVKESNEKETESNQGPRRIKALPAPPTSTSNSLSRTEDGKVRRGRSTSHPAKPSNAPPARRRSGRPTSAASTSKKTTSKRKAEVAIAVTVQPASKKPVVTSANARRQGQRPPAIMPTLTLNKSPYASEIIASNPCVMIECLSPEMCDELSKDAQGNKKGPKANKKESKGNTRKKAEVKLPETLNPDPKTGADLRRNTKLLMELNKNHEDDLFQEAKKPKESDGRVGVEAIRGELFNSDSETDYSIHSARTPLIAYFENGSSESPSFNYEDENAEMNKDGDSFRHNAYLSRKINEGRHGQKWKLSKKLSTQFSPVVTNKKKEQINVQLSKHLREFEELKKGLNREASESDNDMDSCVSDDTVASLANPPMGLVELYLAEKRAASQDKVPSSHELHAKGMLEAGTVQKTVAVPEKRKKRYFL